MWYFFFLCTKSICLPKHFFCYVLIWKNLPRRSPSITSWYSLGKRIGCWIHHISYYLFFFLPHYVMCIPSKLGLLSEGVSFPLYNENPYSVVFFYKTNPFENVPLWISLEIYEFVQICWFKTHYKLTKIYVKGLCCT